MTSRLLPPDFDAALYLALNPDVRRAGVDPTEHYLCFGIKENRPYKNMASELRPKIESPYDFDGLLSIHNHDFMNDEEFLAAYSRGTQATGRDYEWYWRVHIGLWAARSAVRVEGDFVECGVNLGFMSSAIMHHLKWGGDGRMFYLLDTFSGFDERFVSAKEREAGILEKNNKDWGAGFYTDNVARVRENFSEWTNVKIVVGSIPETLCEISSEKIAFLHIDLNCSPPEVGAMEGLWDRIVRGGVVLLDDYAYYGYQPQKEGMDEWAARRDVPIASLPTGQGLILKC